MTSSINSHLCLVVWQRSIRACPLIAIAALSSSFSIRNLLFSIASSIECCAQHLSKNQQACEIFFQRRALLNDQLIRARHSSALQFPQLAGFKQAIGSHNSQRAIFGAEILFFIVIVTILD